MKEEWDDFENHTEPPVVGRLERIPELQELEIRRKEKTNLQLDATRVKENLEKARDYATSIIVSDPDTIELGAAVMKMALQSEDEGVRLKALGMLLDRLVPRVKAVGGEEDAEVVNIPESRKTLLADIEEEIRKGRAAG